MGINNNTISSSFPRLFFVSVLVFLSSLKSLGFAIEGRETIEEKNLLHHTHTVQVSSLLPSTTCTPSTKGAISLSHFLYIWFLSFYLSTVSVWRNFHLLPFFYILMILAISYSGLPFTMIDRFTLSNEKKKRG